MDADHLLFEHRQVWSSRFDTRNKLNHKLVCDVIWLFCPAKRVGNTVFNPGTLCSALEGIVGNKRPTQINCKSSQTLFSFQQRKWKVCIVSINITSVNRCFIIFPIWRVYQSDVVVVYLSLFWKCDITVISYSRCYERKNTLICDVNINVWYIFAFLLSSWHSQHIPFLLLSISITTQMFASTLDVFLH